MPTPIIIKLKDNLDGTCNGCQFLRVSTDGYRHCNLFFASILGDSKPLDECIEARKQTMDLMSHSNALKQLRGILNSGGI